MRVRTMTNNLEGSDLEKLTDVNELLRNLSDLLKMKDERIAYLASEGVQRLAALRVAAANSGFVHWNLLNKTPLTANQGLSSRYRSLMDTLGTLAESLRVIRGRQSLDPQIEGAVSRIQEAWEVLKENRSR
jgi:predicted component of type VI protein secretion system